MRIAITIFILILGFITINPFKQIVLAQNSNFAVAYSVAIEGENIQKGHLISLVKGKYLLSREKNDTAVIGVVDTDPAISLQVDNQEVTYPVVYTGYAFALVNNSNGEIKSGDKITASAVKGEGMKAADTEFTIGEALEDAEFTSGENTDLVLILLKSINGQTEKSQDIEGNIFSNLGEIFYLGKDYANESPSTAFRNILAAFIVLLTIVFAYFAFARVAQRGIEAIGRNPLAKKSIITGIILNVIIAGLIIIAGIVVAYYVIHL